MDLDDDELWSTQYRRNYIKKSKIKEKIKEIKENCKDCDKKHVLECTDNYFSYYCSFSKVIQVLEQLLKE